MPAQTFYNDNINSDVFIWDIEPWRKNEGGLQVWRVGVCVYLWRHTSCMDKLILILYFLFEKISLD